MSLDIDMGNERFWELYVEYCERNGLEPTVNGYVQWLDERY